MKNITAAMVRSSVGYDKETGVFFHLLDRGHRKAGDPAGSRNVVNGYVELSICGIKAYGHRMAWLYEHGTDAQLTIDHINGVRHDNRISNLRLASRAVNSQNTRAAQKNSVSGFLGVSYCKFTNRWKAQITAGRNYTLGRFDTPELAYEAYLTAKRQMHEGCTI